MSKRKQFTTFLDNSFVCLCWLKMADRSDMLNPTSGKTRRFTEYVHDSANKYLMKLLK